MHSARLWQGISGPHIHHPYLRHTPLHPPAPGALPHRDAFVAADLCAHADAFEPASFDLELSSFTVEHFADPPAAIRAASRVAWPVPQPMSGTRSGLAMAAAARKS